MRLLIVVLIVAALVSACGSEESQATATQVVTEAPTVASTNTPIIEPTNPSTIQPTETSIQPTAVAVQPTETSPAPTDILEAANPPVPAATLTATATDAPESIPTAVPAPVAGGNISFRDNLAVADQFVLTLSGISPPPSGFAYEGWLIADDGITEISTGVFDVSADGRAEYVWTSPNGENLIAKYASFAVTIEPAEDSDPGPSTEVVFRGTAAPDVLVAARRIFALNDGEPATPRNGSYGQGLLAQSKVASGHISNAFNGAAIGAFAEMRVHCEHVINIIDGTDGPRYADYNGDGRAENPGDGFGALAYARQIAVLLPGASEDLNTVENLLTAIQDKAEEIIAAPDIASAQPLLAEFKTLAEQLLNEAAPAFYSAAQAAVSYPVNSTP